MYLSDLPSLDCHAHIAPDVTPAQVRGLRGALIFAMTRSPAEARATLRRYDESLLWGFGVHPGLPGVLSGVSDGELAIAVRDFVMLGEVGLDQRGPAGPQRHVFEAVLNASLGKHVLLSVHSTGRTADTIAVLRQQPHPGVILHWFNGSPDEIAEAISLGCYLSVNNAVTEAVLSSIDVERILPETDFPAARRRILAQRPGDTESLERKLALRYGASEHDIRLSWYANLKRLTEAAGVTARLPLKWREALAMAGQK